MADRELNFGADATDADWQIRDDDPANGGDLVVEHLPTGAEFRYDTAEDAWVPNQPIGTSANPVPGTSHIENAEGTSLQYEQGVIDSNGTGGFSLTTGRVGTNNSLTAKPFSIELFPSDGNDRSHYLVCNNPNTEQFGFIKFEVDGTDGLISANEKGGGTPPTTLEFDNTFTDGITFNSPTTLSPPQSNGTESTVLADVGTNHEQTGIETATSVVAGDNTAQPVITLSDPPLNGLLIISGHTEGTSSENTFQDIVSHIRTTIHPINKQDGSTSMTGRSYTTSGGQPQITIDHSGVSYQLNVWFLGGGI